MECFIEFSFFSDCQYVSWPSDFSFNELAGRELAVSISAGQFLWNSTLGAIGTGLLLPGIPSVSYQDLSRSVY